MSFIKKKKDMIFGVSILVFSVSLLIRDNIKGSIRDNPPGGYFARADVYLDSLLYLLLFFSIILMIGSLNFKKEKVEKLTFEINLPAILTMVSLIIYTILLPVIGFVITTLFLVSFLVILYSIYEVKNGNPIKGKVLQKIVLRGVVYSVVSVAALYVVFSNLLNVNLP